MSEDAELTMASFVRSMLPKLKETPQRGFRERVMRITVEDICDAGGMEVDSIELTEGEPEQLLAALDAKGGA